ncbi:MAG: hypothetical protein K2K25_09555, partial [Muribaculaceae bacterium]|nr:hypothetical protein [Muribaculaceae bacterium]
CVITEKEEEYIKNDVLVVSEALKLMLDNGHTSLTIGSACLQDYTSRIGKEIFDALYPNIYDIKFTEKEQDEYGANNAGEYIRNSYRGGWCYVVEGKENRVFRNGLTADVNSLYPSEMHSCSGNYYPIGKPTFWKGNYIPKAALTGNTYYFIRIKTRFYIKDGYLPFIQMKNNFMYRQNECLKSSDITWNGKKFDRYIDTNGQEQDARVILTLTMTDYKRIQDFYNLCDMEILDGCYFQAEIGLFDEYIDSWYEIKSNSTGAVREQSKLFLNNLYGKFGASPFSGFKYAVEKDGKLAFINVIDNSKKPGYIPIGSAITSYARDFTIRHAQANYYGPDKPGFIYADTDSIHCDLKPDELIGIETHPSAMRHWKLESYWDVGFFMRQKTYIEHCTHKDGNLILDDEGNPKPFYLVKACGMPKECNWQFVASLEGEIPEPKEGTVHSPAKLEFMKKKRTVFDMKPGLCIPERLKPKRIPGGVVLVEEDWTMR